MFDRTETRALLPVAGEYAHDYVQKVEMPFDVTSILKWD